MTPAIAGLSHISLSVRASSRRDAARFFWVEVLGFELIDEQPRRTASCWTAGPDRASP